MISFARRRDYQDVEVVSSFQCWVNRMALSFFGSANLVRPGLRPNGPFEHCVAIALGKGERPGG